VRFLKIREGDVAKGAPITPKIGRLRFEDAARDVVNDYRVNGKRSTDEVQRRIDKHLTPYLGHRRLAPITTPDVRAYIAQRQAETSITRAAYDITLKDGSVRRIPEQRRAVDRISNAEINRELTTLKRIFNLAIQAGKLLHKPYIPMLREDNARQGFFDPDQIAAVVEYLPADLQPVIEFAYITGWRIASEVLPLEWRQVDLRAGEVRLLPGTTKNRDGRVFPLTTELRALLEDRQRAADDVKHKHGRIVPWVCFRLVAKGRGGEKHPRQIRSVGKAWKAACLAAGFPGRIPHDLRRSAVRNMVRAGIAERVAMKLTGHKTRSVFERYNIVSDGDLITAARKLSSFGAGTISGTIGGSR